MSKKRMFMVSVVGLIVVGGCAQKLKLEPETIHVDQNRRLTIEGSVEKGTFCAKLGLETDESDVALHSVNLIGPGGEKLPPDSWHDKTPKKVSPKFSVGMGMPLGGGSSDRSDDREDCHGEDDSESSNGGGMRVLPGVSFPLSADGDGDRTVTAVKACWNVPLGEAGSDTIDYFLEVNLAVVRPEKIEITTVPMTLTYHEDEPSESDDTTEQKPASEPESESDISEMIREIDFTLKAPPTTKTIET